MPLPLVFGHYESIAQASADRENDGPRLDPIRARPAGAKLVGAESAAVNSFSFCGASCARRIEPAEAMV